MKIKYLKTAIVLLFIILHLPLTYAGNKSLLEVKKLDDDGYIINVKLSSGTKINNVRYIHRNIMDDWILQVKTTYDSPFGIISTHYPTSRLTNEEFMELIDTLFSYLHKEKKNLDGIQLELTLVDEVWKENIAYFIKEVPRNHKVTGKDRFLANKIKGYLESAETSKYICLQVKTIFKNKQCRSIGAMNPLPYPKKYWGKKWEEVKHLDNLGIDSIDKVDYGIDFI